MNPLIEFAIRSAGGQLLRLVTVPEKDAAAQCAPGETFAVATEQDREEAGQARAELRGRLQALRAARDADREAEAVLLEAFRAKVELTPADLTAARQRLAARRRVAPPT
jgi:hypothetical protein